MLPVGPWAMLMIAALAFTLVPLVHWTEVAEEPDKIPYAALVPYATLGIHPTSNTAIPDAVVAVFPVQHEPIAENQASLA